ncbi:hypothetical protein FQA39_LY03239 [Lamprigera yunnana]|nr:hypothetical protein FQA39_LY03239 [Lamprigera yunnana]
MLTQLYKLNLRSFISEIITEGETVSLIPTGNIELPLNHIFLQTPDVNKPSSTSFNSSTSNDIPSTPVKNKKKCDDNNPIDLTWPFNENTISWGTTQQFVFTNKTVQEDPWYAENDFAVSEHAGTHLDAPYHVLKSGWKIGDIPLSRLTGPGIKIDISNETKSCGSKAQLQEKHLVEWEKKNGPIPKNSILLVYMDWSQNYYDKVKYLGGEKVQDYKFPSISLKAAKWIVDKGKIIGVGIDTASVDLGNSTDLCVHNLFSKNRIYILENVKILASLPAKGFRLYVLPMFIEKGTGAPVRIVAYMDKKHH